MRGARVSSTESLQGHSEWCGRTPVIDPSERLARENDAEMARLTGIIFDLVNALNRIRRLANNPKHQGNAIAEIYEVATMGARVDVGGALSPSAPGASTPSQRPRE